MQMSVAGCVRSISIELFRSAVGDSSVISNALRAIGLIVRAKSGWSSAASQKNWHCVALMTVANACLGRRRLSGTATAPSRNREKNKSASSGSLRLTKPTWSPRNNALRAELVRDCSDASVARVVGQRLGGRDQEERSRILGRPKVNGTRYPRHGTPR